MVSKNLFKENIKNSKVYTLALLRWIALSLIIGLVCGAIGALFYRGISFVTTLRLKYDWLLYLLPIGGLASVFIYKRLKVYDLGTGVVFDSVRSEKQLPILLAPAVFLGSLITHLFGDGRASFFKLHCSSRFCHLILSCISGNEKERKTRPSSASVSPFGCSFRR